MKLYGGRTSVVGEISGDVFAMQPRLPLRAEVEFLRGEWKAELALSTALNALLRVVVSSCRVDTTNTN